MNLIVCDQQCKHQQEGYCTLNHISSLTADSNNKCGYFTHKESGVTPGPATLEDTSAPYYADRL